MRPFSLDLTDALRKVPLLQRTGGGYNIAPVYLKDSKRLPAVAWVQGESTTLNAAEGGMILTQTFRLSMFSKNLLELDRLERQIRKAVRAIAEPIPAALDGDPPEEDVYHRIMVVIIGI